MFKQGLIGLFLAGGGVSASSNSTKLEEATDKFLSSTAEASDQKHHHPVVQAAANTIDIDNRGNVDYFGPLYIGDDYKENHMIYDTMSDWTIIVGDNAKGSSFPGNYDESASTTAKPSYYGYKGM